MNSCPDCRWCTFFHFITINQKFATFGCYLSLKYYIMCMFEAIFFRSFHRFSLPFMDSTAHLILVINLDALASDTECCFCLFPKKYTYCDSDRTLTQLIIISRDSLKPLSHTRMSFLSDHFEIQFSFLDKCLCKIVPICNVRANDTNDISVGCHNHHRFWQEIGLNL